MHHQYEPWSRRSIALSYAVITLTVCSFYSFESRSVVPLGGKKVKEKKSTRHVVVIADTTTTTTTHGVPERIDKNQQRNPYRYRKIHPEFYYVATHGRFVDSFLFFVTNKKYSAGKNRMVC